MIPVFALVFSEDTVTLLHREGGWTPLGDAALDSQDLPDRLAELRGLAEAQAGGDFTTKLVIPASQVLFTVVPLRSDADHDEQVRSALDGLTPYEVAELVHDWQAIGQHAHIAVVARETLHEAEGFATDHGFNPVAFAAIAPEGRFPSEPWFGPTMVAPRFLGEDVPTRDMLPIIVSPPAIEPPFAAEDRMPEPAPSGDDVPDHDALPIEHTDPPAPLWDEPEPVALPEDLDAYAPHPVVTPPYIQDDILPEDEAPLRDESLPEETYPAVDAHDPLPEDDLTAGDLPPSEEYGASEWMRDDGKGDALPQSEDDAPDHSAQVVVDLPPEEADRDQHHPAVEDLSQTPSLLAVEDTAQAERDSAPDAPPVVIPPAAPLPVFDHPSFMQKPALRAERDLAAPSRSATGRIKVSPPLVTTPGEAPFVDFGRSAGAAPADMIPPPLRVTQSRATDFAGRDAPRQRPRYLGLILTVVLLIALALVAAASAYFGDETSETISGVNQPAPVMELAGAGAQPTLLAAGAVPEQVVALVTSPRFQLIPTASADERPAVQSGSLAQAAPATAAEPSPAPDPRLAGATPRARPASLEATQAAPAPTVAAFVVEEHAGHRPRLRPQDLQPTPEELVEAEDTEGQMTASPRPFTRPESVANAAITAPEPDDTGTALAVAVSQRPEMRPSGVSRASVNAALAAALEPPPAATAPAAAPPTSARVAAVATPRAAPPQPAAPKAVPEAPRSVAPSIPTRASVAQQATETGALPLGRTNVISITGASSNRTALVRASNGRISRLRVGDRLDGGVVAAITQNAIHYRKGNTLYALEMPS